MLAFIWKYKTHGYQNAFYRKNKFAEGIHTNAYVCDAKQKLDLWKIDFGWFHDKISCYPMPLLAVLGSRLAEVGVRTTFLVMTSMATLLFDELDQRIDNLIEQSVHPNAYRNGQKMSNYLDKWKSHYDLVCRFANCIDRCFGCILAIICLIDFTVPIFECSNELKFHGTNPQYYLQFVHISLRFLIILIGSHRVKSKVIISSQWCCNHFHCFNYSKFFLLI